MAAWMKWREMAGLICDMGMPNKLKSKIYGTVLKLVLMHETECWTMRKKEEVPMRSTEMQMLRWIVAVSRKDRVSNEEIKIRCGMEDILEKVREARLRWFGHVSGRDDREAI